MTMVTNEHHLELRREIRKLKRAPSFHELEIVKRYMGSSKEMVLIGAKPLRKMIREWMRRHRELSPTDYYELMTSLSRSRSHNEVTIPGRFLEYSRKLRRELDPKMIDIWLNNVEGWGEVDALCQSGFEAEDLLSKWGEWKGLLTKLSFDANIHKRRASLVLLTRPVRESADERLIEIALENVERLKRERDTLITKAVSWLLRSMIKNNRGRLEAYLMENRETLPRIAVREVERKLRTGRK